MKIVVYKSVHHGNTKIIAEKISEELGAEMVDLENFNPKLVEKAELIGFGSGIYFGKHHRELLELIDNLGKVNGKKSFIFSTSGIRKIPLIHNFDRSIIRRLKEKGFVIVGSFSCRGFTSHSILRIVGGIHKGKPDKKDRERAREFARKLAD